MSTVDSLTAWGVLLAPDVVRIAAQVGLPLAAAAAMLEQESGGGRNVFGGDKVPTGGAYAYGDQVTEARYRAYAAWRDQVQDGRGRCQGVGPTQLTSRGFQVQADELGGCWQPIPNMTVGFRLLAGYIARWGLADAFRAYNGGAGNRVKGSNVNADLYSDKAMAKYARWAVRLGPDSTIPGTVPVEDDMQPDERAALLALGPALAQVRDMLGSTKPGVRLPGRSAGLAQTVDDAFGWTMTAAGRADDAAAGVAALRAQVDKLIGTPADIDYERLAAVLLPHLVAALTGAAPAT